MHCRTRTRTRTIVVVLAALAFGATNFMASGASANVLRTAAAAASAPSIVPYLTAAGGQELVVPDGVYVGGRVAVPHDDWLILRAETPGGVVLDLAQTGLQLEDGTSKVIFVGFRFVNGEVRMAGVSDVHFWYCDFTFPPAEWFRQYTAAGGYVPADRRARDRFGAMMANPTPTAVRTRQGLADPSVDNARLGFWGSDFHDLGDDGIFFTRAADVRMAGLRIWNVKEGRFDPGQPYGNSGDWWHNDGIQTIGRVSNVAIDSSWIGQKLQWGTESGDITDAAFRDLWFAGSSTFGQINSIVAGHILANTQESIRAFANGQLNGPAFNRLRTDFVGGLQRAVWPRQYRAPGVFEITTTGVVETVPAGISITNGRLVDITQVRDHAANPANLWRVAHPYDSWGTLLLGR